MYPIGMTAFGVAVDIAGNLYVSDANSQITKVTPIASPPLQFVISAGRQIPSKKVKETSESSVVLGDENSYSQG